MLLNSALINYYAALGDLRKSCYKMQENAKVNNFDIKY